MIRRKSLVHAVMTGKTLQTCCEVSGARKRRQYLLSAVSDSVLAGYCLIRVLWNWLGWSSILGSPYRSHCTLTITSSGDYQFQNDFSCSCFTLDLLHHGPVALYAKVCDDCLSQPTLYKRYKNV